MTSFYEQHMHQIGLIKLSQYAVLANFSEQKTDTGSARRKLDMDRTILTRSLRPLLDQGWIEAYGDDARQRWLVLTPKGSVFRQQPEVHWRDAQLALESQLGREFVANLNLQMLHALSQLKVALRKPIDHDK